MKYDGQELLLSKPTLKEDVEEYMPICTALRKFSSKKVFGWLLLSNFLNSPKKDFTSLPKQSGLPWLKDK